MSTQVDDSIFDLSQESYNELFERFETKMTFKGYTIQEWNIALDLKDLPPDFSLNDLERYNLKVTNQTNTISKNFALASSNYIGLKKSVERALMIAKQTILDELEEYNSTIDNPASKKRAPSNDKLEAEAYNRTLKLQLDLSVAEMFYNFWEIQWKRINLINSRLTSLSVMKNTEFKMSTI